MAKYKFIKEKDESNEFDKSRVEFQVETESLLDLIEEFELFLKASGFSLKGNLEVVVDTTD